MEREFDSEDIEAQDRAELSKHLEPHEVDEEMEAKADLKRKYGDE